MILGALVGQGSISPFLLAKGAQMNRQEAENSLRVERLINHAERPDFRITEIQISPTQSVPWHYHNDVQDTFYVLEGRLRIFLRDPKEQVQLAPGETYSVAAQRPHFVTNGGRGSTTFFVLQRGAYDYVALKNQMQSSPEPGAITRKSGQHR